MKKEVLIAIIVGFSLGLIITFGVYRAQKSIKEKVSNQDSANQEDLPINSPDILLSISQPSDGSITDQDVITVGGITKKNALVTIISSQDHQSTQADELGNFSVEFELDGGENQIQITSFSDNGVKQSKTVSVVYSTYEFDEIDGDDNE